MKIRPEKKFWAIPVLVFMYVSILYYILIFAIKIEPKVINWMSSTVKLLGYATFAIYWIAKMLGRFNGKFHSGND